MARIVIQNLGKSLEAIDLSKTILQHVHDSHIDWMHACGGKGRCTTCKAIILEGEANLTPLTKAELHYKKQGLLNNRERLACQTRILGEVTVQIPEEGQLPHLIYLPG
jgi:ferredoxin, 2Fe-2S